MTPVQPESWTEYNLMGICHQQAIHLSCFQNSEIRCYMWPWHNIAHTNWQNPQGINLHHEYLLCMQWYSDFPQTLVFIILFLKSKNTLRGMYMLWTDLSDIYVWYIREGSRNFWNINCSYLSDYFIFHKSKIQKLCE